MGCGKYLRVMTSAHKTVLLGHIYLSFYIVLFLHLRSHQRKTKYTTYLDILVMRLNFQPIKLATRRVSAHATSSTSSNDTHIQGTSSSVVISEWFKVKDGMTQQRSDHNLLHDACRAGRAARASGQSSSATSERPEGVGNENPNRKAEKEYPKAPKPVIGMNDERGHVSTSFIRRVYWKKY